MMAPVTICCTQFGTPTCVHPVLMTVMRKAPIIDPAMVPSPPESEPPPITTLDLGPADCDAQYVWGANMALRRRAFELAGPFDETLAGRGDEEEWERRFVARGGRVRYVAAAEIVHRRSRSDARLVALCRAAFALGRTARRNDARKHAMPPAWFELRVLAGCGWHAVRRRCAYGIVMGAHSAGRVREMVGGRGRAWSRASGGSARPTTAVRRR